MHKLQVYTIKGSLLDTIECNTGNTVVELVKDALAKKKIKIEEARCLHQMGKDGKWFKIKWKAKVPNVPTVFKVTKDPLKMRLKHRIRVVDFQGEQVGLIPTKSGRIVKNIVSEVASVLELEVEKVMNVEVLKDKKFKKAPMNGNIEYRDIVVVTVDEKDRERIRLEDGEPILPRCLTILRLEDLLRSYKHPSKGKEPRGKSIDVEEFIEKLKGGYSVTEDEKYLISRSVVDPLYDHCLTRGRPWRNECRLYLNNLFEPYPQLHVTDFVSSSNSKIESGVFEDVVTNKRFLLLQFCRRNRGVLINALPRSQKR
ncbi:unnamed protein product [Bursaphelenchus okinawaensis]|uniref:Uncharacterized protein n=1 Tax=Bursaphelenchus okinawaensis TaxID=465554 RepID=A0A811JQJ3_9BILA|nr:unnamed protein product [Bursaphelenchus okinawaensis]CAG9078556.1 unnamed protein product [Bursaphelenchus okinawaensis]